MKPGADLEQRQYASPDLDLPVSCIAIPEISCVSVDFPDPFAPTMPKNSPRLTSKLTSESAQKLLHAHAPRRTRCASVC